MKNYLSSIISLVVISAFAFSPFDLTAQSNSNNKTEKKQTYKKARVLTSKTAKKVAFKCEGAFLAIHASKGIIET